MGHTDINGALDVAGNTTFSNNVVIGGNLNYNWRYKYRDCK